MTIMTVVAVLVATVSTTVRVSVLPSAAWVATSDDPTTKRNINFFIPCLKQAKAKVLVLMNVVEKE